MCDAQNIWQAFVSAPCEATFTPVYERTKGLVWTLCYRILGNPEDARDGFQSAYCRLFAEVRAGTWEAGAEEDATQALYRLAVRESQNLWRRRARRAGKEVAMDAIFDKPDGAAAADEVAARRQVREQVEALVADRLRGIGSAAVKPQEPAAAAPATTEKTDQETKAPGVRQRIDILREIEVLLGNTPTVRQAWGDNPIRNSLMISMTALDERGA